MKEKEFKRLLINIITGKKKIPETELTDQFIYEMETTVLIRTYLIWLN